jgi:hypothetical protein
MPNLENALQQLREERRQAQLRVEKLYQAISVIESLDGSGASASQPERPASYRQLHGAKWRGRSERDGQE